MTMTTEISPQILKSTDYEMWKLETLAWAVVTESVVVALNLPGDDNKILKGKVFGELS